MAEATFTFGGGDRSFGGHTSSLDIVDGPRSIDLLLLALGGCTVVTVGHYMQRKELPTDNLRLTLSSELDAATNRYADISITVFVDSGISKAQIQAINSVAKACRIHKTLEHPPDIRIDISREQDPETA